MIVARSLRSRLEGSRPFSRDRREQATITSAKIWVRGLKLAPMQGPWPVAAALAVEATALGVEATALGVEATALAVDYKPAPDQTNNANHLA